MSFIIRFLLELPLGIRVAIILLLMIVLWRIFGKVVLWILSIVPFLLEKMYIFLYQIVELPITILHKKFGGGFYKIDKFMAEFGGKIDSELKKWYEYWHHGYKFHWGKAILVYFICWAFIALPSLLSLENNVLKAGEKLYLSSESILIACFEKDFPYESKQETIVNEDEQIVPEKEEIVNSKIELVVAGVSSSLLVRDIPNMDNSVALERLHNGDKVVWTGELTFAKAENNHVETWAKITTQNGVEGWSRLFYLHPEDYTEKLFYVNAK